MKKRKLTAVLFILIASEPFIQNTFAAAQKAQEDPNVALPENVETIEYSSGISVADDLEQETEIPGEDKNENTVTEQKNQESDEITDATQEAKAESSLNGEGNSVAEDQEKSAAAEDSNVSDPDKASQKSNPSSADESKDSRKNKKSKKNRKKNSESDFNSEKGDSENAEESNDSENASPDETGPADENGADTSEGEPEQKEKLPRVNENGVVYKDLGLEGMDNEVTEKFRQQFSQGYGKRLLIMSLENSARYRPYIIQKLTEMELPLYLQYLPIIESNFLSTAVSKSGATGIWQFMENSMYPMLKKDPWYDERRDGWKSTDAALTKLKDNYNLFENWDFALGAYNCGTGGMRRYIKEHPDKTFWDMVDEDLINNQTRLYVPKLLAIADLVENAEFYGLDDIKELNDSIISAEIEEFDYITTKGMYSFQQIADATGINKDEIRELNHALFRNCTPARQNYELRLPKGSGEEALEKLKHVDYATDAIIYTVESGDSLWGISRKFGLTVDDICQVNGIKENGVLSIGKRLIVPIFN